MSFCGTSGLTTAPGKAHRLVGGFMTASIALRSSTALAAIVLSLPGIAHAQASDPQTAEAPKAADAAPASEEQSGDIVVTGVRASLARALSQKRDAIGVQETVAAKDLADFPDQNIGSALQRLTGVTVTRGGQATTDVGRTEASSVRLRGLPPEFTQTTVNGMLIVSPSSGRQTDFSIFPSELFSAVDVRKTQSADLTEGGLSGNVNLRIAQPLDQKGFNGVVTVRDGLQPHVDGFHPEASGVLGYTNPDRTFGVLVAASYANYVQRSDLSQGFQFNSASVDTAGTKALVPFLPRQGVWIFDRDRFSIAGALQWRPTDRFELNFDALYANVKEVGKTYNLGGQIGATVPTGSKINVIDGVASSGTLPGVLNTTESARTPTNSNLLALNFNGRYDVTDRLKLTGLVGYSKATLSHPLTENYQYSRTAAFQYDLHAGGNPNYVSFSSPDFSYADMSAWTLNRVRYNRDKTKDDELTFQGDLRYELDGPIKAISVGAQHRVRDKNFSASAYGGDATAVFGRPTLTQTGELLPYDGVLPNGPSDIVRNYAVVDFDKANAAFGSLIDKMSPTLLSHYKLRETVTGAYGKADLGFNLGSVSVTGDAGVRWVRTDQSSQGYQLVSGQATELSVSRSYTDVLPSANLRFELTPSLLLRLGVSKSLTRPTPAQIVPQRNVTNIALRLATVGNPDLEPYRATNLDASLEWYFGKESLLSAAFFYKKVDSFIINVNNVEPLTGPGLIDNGVDVSGQNFTVTKPINGQGAKVKGLEVSYQQPFTFLPKGLDGFGTVLNATYADSTATSTVGTTRVTTTLPGLAKWSYNVIGYYEKYGLSLRLAYSWRGKYLEAFAVGTQQSMIAAAGYLDFSARYDITKAIAVTFDAQNLTSQGTYSYIDKPDRNRIYFASGPTFRVGARMKF